MKRLSVLLIVALVGFTFGCGSSRPAISVALSPSAALTIVQGQQANLSAAVLNDSKSQGVTWALSGKGCTGSACGTLTNITTTGATYNTPTSVSSKLTVTVTATTVADTAKSTSIAISVVPLPSVTTTLLPDGLQDAVYTATTLAASGGITPYTWSVTAGSLPTGMALSSGGVISGKPTAAGTANFTVQVADSSSPALKAAKALSILVNPPPPLSITTVSMPNGVQGTAYSATPLATGGTLPYTWSVTAGSLPTGLTLHPATGVIDGMPTAAGTSSFTVQAADSTTPALTSTKMFSIVIAPPPLTINTATLPGGTVNSVYTATTLAASGGTPPIAWSVTAGAMPAGLTLRPTGLIDGTPIASGTFTFTVTATDSAATPQTKTQLLSIVVAPALSITTASLPDGAMNTAYTATLVSSDGTAPVTWSVRTGTLPAGLTLNSATGVISGSPTTVGKVDFTVEATDHSTPPQTPVVALSITVAPAPFVISTSTMANATIGATYNATLQATGGTPPISWSVTTGVLPSGLTLHSTTGVIDGTPTGSPATTNFTVTATDSGSPIQNKTQALSITTVSGGANNAELNGHYAFVLRGFDSTNGGLVTMAGSFAADGNGNVTGGVEDINTTSTINSDLAITGGFYSIGADQRGTVTLTTSQGNSTFDLVLGSITSGVSSVGRMIGSDSRMVAGDLKKQDTSAFSTASITGKFAFGIGGASSAGGQFAAAGVMTADGAGNFSITMDANDGGTVGTDTFIGIYAVSDTVNGRGILTDTTNGSHMSWYLVSASEVFLINVDPYSNSGPPIFTGSALKQTGTLSNSSMNGTKSVFMSQSVSSYSGGVPAAAYTGTGLVTWTTTGTATVEMDENDGGAVTHSTGIAVSYAVASNGRMTMTIGGNPMTAVFYLVSPGKAFSVGTNGAASEGLLKPQSGSNFNNASLSGSYIFGVVPPIMSSSINVGVVTLDGAGAVTGTLDENSGGTLTVIPFTDTYSVSANGRVVLNDTIMYLITTSKAVMMSKDQNQTKPTIQIADK